MASSQATSAWPRASRQLWGLFWTVRLRQTADPNMYLWLDGVSRQVGERAAEMRGRVAVAAGGLAEMPTSTSRKSRSTRQRRTQRRSPCPRTQHLRPVLCSALRTTPCRARTGRLRLVGAHQQHIISGALSCRPFCLVSLATSRPRQSFCCQKGERMMASKVLWPVACRLTGWLECAQPTCGSAAPPRRVVPSAPPGSLPPPSPPKQRSVSAPPRRSPKRAGPELTTPRLCVPCVQTLRRAQQPPVCA